MSADPYPPRPDGGGPTLGGPVQLCGLRLAHPVVNGSGTFDARAARRAFGEQLRERFPFSAYVSKTITLRPRAGNPPPRLWEAAQGLVNSIGLPNPGVQRWLAEDLPELRELPVPLIVNVMGGSASELEEIVGRVGDQPGVAAVELNVSCPNVATGLDIGAVPAELERVLHAVRPHTRRPLVVKLTPNTAAVADCARAAEAGGADAVSLVNTVRAAAEHPHRPGRAWLGGGTGGLSGPAVRSVALAQVRAVAGAVAVPVIGMGGVSRAEHAAALLRAGATAVAVGTASFLDPLVGARIAAGLSDIAPAPARDDGGREVGMPRRTATSAST